MAQFITQVATSIEQSQQLIELGVKPETADLVYRCTKSKTDSLEWELQLCPPSLLVKYSFCIPFISDFWNHLIAPSMDFTTSADGWGSDINSNTMLSDSCPLSDGSS